MSGQAHPRVTAFAEDYNVTLNSLLHRGIAAGQLSYDLSTMSETMISVQTVYGWLAQRNNYDRKLLLCFSLFHFQKRSCLFWICEQQSWIE
ncbi:hypothetical protein TNIN_400481 [Trichonephila inaurata madagascariensis]|nr:hypothetical protein TNIN_400481 [Trichonephila inaurata madagascariensis]